jgi:hypothetical protein
MAVSDARERAIATLTEAFTKDVIEIEQLEERLSLVHNAETEEELTKLVADLAPPTQGIAPRPPTLAVTEVKDQQAISAVFGAVERKGAWNGARHMKANAMFGSVVLDFREARLPAGVFELDVTAAFGSVEIIVPPDLAVESNGNAVLGSFEGLDRAPEHPSPDRPLLRIQGTAMFGSVEIETRLVGESGGEAWARKREERRALRRKYKDQRRLAKIEARQQRRLARGK